LFIVFTVVDIIGLSDFAYKRVISKASGSLIVGTSRAAQALQPSSMNPVLVQAGFSPVYNFAFTISDSPFGEVYFKAISRKLDRVTDSLSTRLFIVSVDPFSLSSIDELDRNGIRDTKGILSGLPGFFKPNYFYLIKYFKPKEWVETGKYQYLHDDGWLEILVDSTDVGRNKQERIDLYRSYSVRPSQERVTWLDKTIALLQGKGDVYLCRLSTCSEMNEIEDRIWPEFDRDMQAMAEKYSVRYFSFSKDYDRYRTFDGNHIYRDDGRLISKALCDSILCIDD